MLAISFVYCCLRFLRSFIKIFSIKLKGSLCVKITIHLATLEVGLYLRRTRGKSYIVLGGRADTFQIAEETLAVGVGQSGVTFESISVFHKQCVLHMSSQKPRTSLLAQTQAGIGITQLDNVTRLQCLKTQAPSSPSCPC